mmetsp:Transcript_25873/g.83455  ORF Transcript_25873/g.83455 Transcript_25873/m.83455 type:complete len:146 (+) Transcript_25873:400-837(+)
MPWPRYLVAPAVLPGQWIMAAAGHCNEHGPHQGCLPVVVTKHRFWMALPFPSQVPWKAFATFKRIQSKEELRDILRKLLQEHEEDQAGIRQRRSALSAANGLFAVHDAQGCTQEEAAAFPRLILRELQARQNIWPHIRSSWLFEG